MEPECGNRIQQITDDYIDCEIDLSTKSDLKVPIIKQNLSAENVGKA